MLTCISNPPYNMKWNVPPFAQVQERFSKCAVPPSNNANYAFILTALEKADRAAFILPCGILSTDNKSEKDIRKYLIDNNLIEGYKTGKGKCYIRSKYHIEDNNIIIDEIPYDVNKQKLVENIKILSKDRIGKNKQKIPAAITGIKVVRDESDKNGIRICIELKNGANSETIINNLIKRRIDFQKSFSINMIAMKNGIPKQYNVPIDCVYWAKQKN